MCCLHRSSAILKFFAHTKEVTIVIHDLSSAGAIAAARIMTSFASSACCAFFLNIDGTVLFHPPFRMIVPPITPLQWIFAPLPSL